MLEDAAGPAGADPELEAIIFTKEVSVWKGIDFVHSLRKQKGLNYLNEIEISLIDGEGGKVSSSSIWEKLESEKHKIRDQFL